MALTLVDQQLDIWTYDVDRKTLNRLTDSPSWDAYPLWQPGGGWIAFASMRDGLASIYRQDLRRGTVEKLIGTDAPIYPMSWSPDGRRLAYDEENPRTGHDIWIYSLDSHSGQVFLRTPYNESHAEFSPDGPSPTIPAKRVNKRKCIYGRIPGSIHGKRFPETAVPRRGGARMDESSSTALAPG